MGTAVANKAARLIIVCIALAASGTAQAAIAVQNYYRLGEIDTPSMPPLTRDHVGGLDLTITNTTSYSGDTSPGTGSSIAMNFASPADYATGSLLSTVNNNFGIATWVKTSDLSAGQHILVFNGNTGGNGFGIIRDGVNWIGLLGGSAQVGGVAVQSGVWTHLALVRDNGITTLYANGVPTGAPAPNPVNPPAGAFAIATAPTNVGAQTLAALVDEVQFFTFAPGQFRTKDMFPAQAQYNCNGDFDDSTLFRRDLSTANFPMAANFSSPTFSANARSGRACVFNSVQALRSVMDDFPYTNEATYSFWINTPGGQGNRVIMQSTDIAFPYNSIDVCGALDPSCMELGLRVFGDDTNFPSSRRFVGSPVVNDNNWHHVAITTTGTLDTAQVYIDGAGPLPFNAAGGQPMSSMNLRGTLYVGTAQGFIGSAPSNFVGSLDDIRVDARVLSAAEIAALVAPPGMGAIADAMTNEDVATAPLMFNVVELQTPGALSFSLLSSSNPSLVGPANVAFGGAGPVRDVTVTPASNQSGTAILTIEVSDGMLTDAQSFTVSVNPVNDPPSFLAGPNLSHPAGTNAAQTATGWATGISDGDPDFVQILNFNVMNDNPSLFSTPPAIAANGTLTYIPSGVVGSATVTVSLSDDGNAGGPALTSANQLFTITILPLDVISNLEANYRCDGDSLDSTAALRHLVTQYGTIGYATNARSGRACQFDGVTRMGSATSAFPQSNDVTYSLWMRKPGVPPTQQIFMQTVTGATTSLTQNSMDLDANPSLRLWGSNLAFPFSFTSVAAGGLYDGNWHHVALTASGTNSSVQIYFDGLPTSTSLNGIDSIVDLATTLYLGSRSDQNSASTANFVGSLDDVSVYSRVLGPADVAQLAAPPGMGAILDTITDEDIASAPLPFNIVDLQTPAASLIVSVVSTSNPTLLPLGNISLAGAGVNRTLTATPAANESGMSTVTVQVSDGVLTDAQSFVLTVNAVNDAPSFVVGVNQSVLEDAGAQTVAGWASAISPGPINEGGQTLNFSITANSNPGLFSVAPTVSPSGVLSYTPAPNANGLATIDLQLMDNGGVANGGVDVSAIQSFNITINSVNDTPSFTAGGPQMVLEDSGAQSVAGWASAMSSGPPDEAGQTLTFIIAANSNPALFSVPPAVSLSGELSYTPAPNATGVANIDLQIGDNGGVGNGAMDTSPIQSFSITVDAVNDPPSFAGSAIAPVLEDAGAQSIPGWAGVTSAGPPDEAGQTVSFVVTAITNPALFSSPPTVSPAGVLSFTPAPNASGSSSFDVQAIDSGGTANGGSNASTISSFDITVNAVNDAPSFAAGANQTVLEDAAPQAVAAWATAINSGPADESAQTVSFEITGNSNPSLFSVPPAVSPAGVLSYTPAANANGSATIGVRARDSGGVANGGVDISAAQNFSIAVTAVNDPPSFAGSPIAPVLEDAGAQSIPGWAGVTSVGPPDEAGQSISFVVTAITNPALFSSPPMVSSAGVLSFTSAPNANGSSSFDVQAIDSGGTADGGSNASNISSFNIIVNPVNDLPSFTKGLDQTLLASAGAQSFANWATAIDDGDPELAQTLSFNVSSNNAALFSAQPSVAANGTLQFTPSGVAGITSVSVSLSDDASAGGAALTSPIQNFTITLRTTPTVAIVEQLPLATVVGQPFDVSVRVVNPTGNLQATGTVNVAVAPIGNQVSCTLGPVATPPGASEALCSGLIARRAVDMIVTASYTGDAVFLSRSSNQVHSVSKAETRLTMLSHTPNPSQSNTPVNVSYQLEVLSPSQSALSELNGEITVSDGPNQVSMPFVASNQMASIVLTGNGTRPLTVRYQGDKNFNDAEDTEPHIVEGGNNTDLSVVISNRREFVPRAGSTTYYVEVGNLGSVASNAQLDALIPAGLSSYSWTCSATAGSSCQSAAGNGSVVAGVNLAPGGLVSYQIQANVNGAEGSVVNNQALITPAIAPPDSNAQNNVSVDRDVIATFASGFEN